MLSGTLLVPFSHSAAVNSPSDKINGVIQNNDCHNYARQKLFLLLNYGKGIESQVLRQLKGEICTQHEVVEFSTPQQ